MSALSTPEMSVIVITPGHFQIVARTMAHLRAQTVRDRLEIVIVAPSREELKLDDSQLNEFYSTCVVEVGLLNSSPQARVAGIRKASAPLVVLTEEHCFPEPDWAEALIRAHREPVAAVGPVFLNANPDTLISWANLLLEYGPWLDPPSNKELNHIPGHNSSYKRDILLQYGERLPDLMKSESTLHWDLFARGYTCRIEPAAKVRHMNFELLLPSFSLRLDGGRLFAASRAQQWSLARRLLYAAASPLIPLVRLRRAITDLRRIGRQNMLLRLLPVLLAMFALDGFGEFLGYLFGAGGSLERLTETEFHREHYLNASAKGNGQA